MGEWRVYFSGRTQREAYVSGELTYIGHLAEQLDCDRFDGGD
jgi:hypothetical protein